MRFATFLLYITCSICQGWAIGIVDIHTKQFFHESVKWKSTIFLSFCNWKSNKYFKKCHSSWLIWGFEMCLKLECWLLPVSILLQASAKSFLFWGQWRTIGEVMDSILVLFCWDAWTLKRLCCNCLYMFFLS